MNELKICKYLRSFFSRFFAAVYAVVRCLAVMFVYCVETAEDKAMGCEYKTVLKLSNGTHLQ